MKGARSRGQGRGEIYFKKVAIIGVGLIGGSLAIVLRRKGIADYIVGVGRGIKNLETAKWLGVVDEWTQDAKHGIEGADLVVIATPVCSIAGIVKEIMPSLKKGAIITDVGSVKKAIVDEIEGFIKKDIYFVGGHPIAGTENGGVEAAFDTLFQDRKCIITPSRKTNKNALRKVRKIWEEAGSRVIVMDSAKHDKILAAISHLPHMAAYSLVNAAADAGDAMEDILEYSAGGFKDITRIASSPPEMWRDICLLNNRAILEMIKKMQRRLSRLEGLIRKKDAEGIISEFNRAKKIRDGMVYKG